MDSNIAIVAVFGVAGLAGSVAIIMQYFTEKLKVQKLQITQQTGGVEQLKQELKSLRQEIAQLRDTTTQYDMSVDKTLHEAQQRITHVEGMLRREYAPPATTADESRQHVRIGGG